VTDRATEFYAGLAAGGIGLIVTGFQYVMTNSVAMPYQMGNYKDSMLTGLITLADVIHAAGGKVMAQLAHTGGKANPELFPKEGDVWGPSAVPEPVTGSVPSRPNILKQEDEAYLYELALSFKKTVKVPIVTVGGISSPKVISRVLSEGFADYVALCRPLIREPYLINRRESGNLEKATCVSCNGCFETGLSGFGVTCKLDMNSKNN
jgi:2,4-dienoyl-CoA reductase-like NADH-dependent reductase (Old Yellow Enzyme family)